MPRFVVACRPVDSTLAFARAVEKDSCGFVIGCCEPLEEVLAVLLETAIVSSTFRFWYDSESKLSSPCEVPITIDLGGVPNSSLKIGCKRFAGVD